MGENFNVDNVVVSSYMLLKDNECKECIDEHCNKCSNSTTCIECIEGYWDIKKLKWIEPGEQWEVDYLRMEYLNDLGLIKVIKEIDNK